MNKFKDYQTLNSLPVSREGMAIDLSMAHNDRRVIKKYLPATLPMLLQT